MLTILFLILFPYPNTFSFILSANANIFFGTSSSNFSIHIRLLHFRETKSFIHVAGAKCIIYLRDYGLMFTKISNVIPSIYQSWETSIEVKKTVTKTLLRNCKLGARKLRFGS